MHPKKTLHHIRLLCLSLVIALISPSRAAMPDYVRNIGGVNYTFIDYSYYAQASTYQTVNTLARLYVPDNYNPANSYPLVVFLHGAGENGTDNTLQVGGNINNLIVNARARGFFVYAHQAPYDFFSDDQKNMMVQGVARALGQYSIDPSRIYATGISMGGGALVQMLQQYPQLFAAYVPLSPAGGFSATTAQQAIGKPHWYFHGWLDGHGTSDNSVNNLVVANGGTSTVFSPGAGPEVTYVFGPGLGLINYTIYANGGHNNTVWNNGAYAKAAMYDWMLSKSTPIHRLQTGKSVTVNFKTTPVNNDRRNPAPTAADGKVWNTIGRNGTYRAVDIAIGFVQDNDGLVSTASFWVNKAFGNVGSSVPSGISAFGDNALNSGYWVTSSGQSGKLLIKGLNPGAFYDLDVFASTTAANYTGTYAAGGQTQTLAATNNLNQLASLTSLQTDSSGNLELTVAPASGSSYAVINSLRLTALNPIDAWRRVHFGTTANSGNAADSADANGNGLSNLLEYALGTNPVQTGSPSPLVSDMVSADTMSLTYTRARTDVQYVVEMSTDLVNWSSAGVNQGQPDANGVTVAQATSTAPAFFMRLRVTLTLLDAVGTQVASVSPAIASEPVVVLPTPILGYGFDETGTAAASSGSTNPATTPTGTLTLLDSSQTAADIHSAGGLGVSGAAADRALNLAAATGMGNTSTGLSPAGKITPNPASIGGLVSFTLQGWFKTDGAVLGSTAYLFHVNNSGMISLRSESAGVLKLYVDSIAASSSSSAYSAASSWVYFAVTYDGTQTANNVKFYVANKDNAVSLVGTQTINAGTVGSFSTQPLIIGNSAGGNRPFDGLVDNIRLFGSSADASGALPIADLESFRQVDITP